MPVRWLSSLRARLDPPAVADPLWRRALVACPLARGLDAEREQRLRRLAALFLARKRFHALAGAVLDDYWRLLIAMQACLPALHQGAGSLRGWREVLIYPGEFKVRGIEHVCHSSVDAWERGPLMLSLADVQLDLEQPWDGYNVVLHEMAHKLDMLDGPPDGIPPLMDISRRRWVEQFEQAFQRWQHGRNREEYHPIDHRAIDNASEYFAVVTEMHYSQPALLRKAEPAIARLLEAFYGPSPASDVERSGNVRLFRKSAAR